MSVNGPITFLAELTAKKSPSDPVGANEAVHDICLGLHKTSPAVMNTCHTQAPAAVGKSATHIDEVAMIHNPGMTMEKSSLPLVNAPTIGGKIRHPNRLIL